MKKIWLAVCLGIALMGSACSPQKVVAPEPSPQVEAQVQQPKQKDNRIALLDAFFAKHHCPYHDSQVYIDAADKYGIDYRLLPALSVVEESCGKYTPNNNLFGYGSATHLKSFPSIEAGINYVASQLATNPLYAGKTLKQQLYTYNSVNPSYYTNVTKLMDEIAP